MRGCNLPLIALSVGFAATSPKGRGFFIIPIVKQIGRENNLCRPFVPAISPLRTTEKSIVFFLQNLKLLSCHEIKTVEYHLHSVWHLGAETVKIVEIVAGIVEIYDRSQGSTVGTDN